MSISLYKKICKLGLLPFVIGSIGFSHYGSAQETINGSDKALTDFIISANKGAELQLEVKQMPLAKVLEIIVKKSEVPIHYSALPKGLVTATCVGSSIKPILECLLDHKADLIFRYVQASDTKNFDKPIAEAWILGSRIESTIATSDCPTITGDNKAMLSFEKNPLNTKPDQTDDLLKAAQAKDPIARAEAIGALLAGGRPDDAGVKNVLEQALKDSDENVRAQAISSLAHREGSSASAAIQEALHDQSADVRMMAVDGITDDKALLQQAINDSDESIRALAATKLEELTQATHLKP